MLVSGEPGIGKSRLTRGAVASASRPSRIRGCAISARRIIRTARFTRLSPSSNAPPASRATTRSKKSSANCEALLAPGARGRGRYCAGHRAAVVAKFGGATSTSARSASARNCSRRCCVSSKLWRGSRPVLMLFEDAHWIDPTSRELLDLTVDRVRAAAGPAGRHLSARIPAGVERPPHVTIWRSNRLGGRDGAALVEQLAGDTELAARDRRRDRRAHRRGAALCRGADQGGAGKRRRDSRVAAVLAAASLAAPSVPATLHASLMARLDRLGPSPRRSRRSAPSSAASLPMI